MRTAIDTNILSALWSREETASVIAYKMHEAAGAGALVASAPVYAELLAFPGATRVSLHKFLEDTGIHIEFELGEAVWGEAGTRYGIYAERRRSANRESPRRILTDFIIGAHALLSTERLMTRDHALYQRNYPELILI